MVLSWRSFLSIHFSYAAVWWYGRPSTLDGLLPDPTIPEVYVESLHVLFACATVPDGLQAAHASLASSKLTAEDVHTAAMAKPAKPALTQWSEYGKEASLGKNFCVWDFVLSENSMNLTQATHLERFQSLLLSCVGCPKSHFRIAVI